MSPVELLQAAAAKVWIVDGIRDDYREPLAFWLEGAAEEAQEIGADFRAERFARKVLGLPDVR